MIAAINRGDIETVERELSRGVDVNRTSEVQMPPVSHPDLADPLPGHTIAGVTPLMYAATSRSPEIVQALVAAGADTAATTGDGKTALHYAAEVSENRAALIALLSAGATVDVQENMVGWTPLMMAALFGDANGVEALIEAGADVTIGRSSGATALHQAAYRFDSSKILLILDAGADLEARDGSGQTPLTWAARQGGLQAVEILLGAGADVHTRDTRGQTALMHVAQDYETGEMIARLMDAGAEVNATDNDGRTALMHAVDTGAIKAVEALLAAGADANARDAKGKTPLMYVSPYGEQVRVIDALLAAGGDLTATDNAGFSIVQQALRNKASDEALARLRVSVDQD
ncbi:MAG: ankyrin repeat domain-containing protein [Planctomycetes bacterium]|nr:ankyrin repeat domain-containing protein [Planctomycetota bacterium]